MTIPYSRQQITGADVKAVVAVLRSDWITQGPMIDTFEKRIARYCGAKYAVAFNSGTAALHAAYFAAGIRESDEVIVPALTFAATANAALYLGAKPIFADIDLKTGHLSPIEAKKNISTRTKAIVPVDYAGRAVDLRPFRALAKKHRLALIADGAQSLGGISRGKKIRTEADMTMFSFHPVKSITTGEGGMIVTNSKILYESMRSFRTHGIVKDRKYLTRKTEGGWYQEMRELGYNYRITDIQAALGISQMNRIDSYVAKRRALAKRYATLLRDIQGVVLPPQDSSDNSSAWHLYPIRLTDARRRKTVFEHLRKAGIGAQVHYLPVYLHPYYRKLGYKKGLCPNAESFYASEISIPLYPTMTHTQQDLVVRKLKSIL